MLMNLLPGLRDLRAPLSAGYLWLVGLWLLLVDAIPPRGVATGILAHVYALANIMGRVPVLAAISFVAYLIGAVLSVDADGAVIANLARLVPIRRGDRNAFDYMRDPKGERDPKEEVAGRFSAKVIDDLVAKVMQLRAGAIIPPVQSDDKFNARAVREQWNRQMTYSDFVMPRWGDAWIDDPWRALLRSMIQALLLEARQLVTQLRVSSPALFDHYDRARGEAEFRISVAFPLTFITAVLAWRWTPLWLLLLLGVILITQSGLRRAQEANDVVAQAVLAGYVTPGGWPSPKSDSLEIAKQVVDRYDSALPEIAETFGERMGYETRGESEEYKRRKRNYSLISQLLSEAHSVQQPTDSIAAESWSPLAPIQEPKAIDRARDTLG
jgi:hypothetical protein